jgi:hypothetical protein
MSSISSMNDSGNFSWGSCQMRIRGRCLHSALHARALVRRLHFWTWSPLVGRRTIKTMVTPPPAAVEIGGPRRINALPRSVPVILTAMAVEHQERWRPLRVCSATKLHKSDDRIKRVLSPFKDYTGESSRLEENPLSSKSLLTSPQSLK